MQVKNVYVEVNTGCCTDLVCSKCVLGYYWCVGGRCHCLFLLPLLHDKSLALLQRIGEHRQDAEKQATPEGVDPQVRITRNGPDDGRQDVRSYQDRGGGPENFESEFYSGEQWYQLLSPL